MALNCMIISVSTVHLKEKELQELRARLQRKEELLAIKNGASNKKIISSSAFYGMLFLSIVLASLAAYGLFFNKPNASLLQDIRILFIQTPYKNFEKQSPPKKNGEKKPFSQKKPKKKKQDSIELTQ